MKALKMIFLGSLVIFSLIACDNEKTIIIPSHYTKKIYTVKGLSCPSCAKTIEKHLEKLPGILSPKVEFRPEISQLEVYLDEKKIGFKDIKNNLDEIGYDVEDGK